MISSLVIEKRLPEYVADTFRSDAISAPAAIPAPNRFAEWFQHSGTPFFKHYTDHSVNHSLDVFQTGIEFASPSAQRLLSARDITYFLLACFCHDAGMHFTEVQFSRLIQHDDYRLYNNIDKTPWSLLWINFLEEAKRFNQKTLDSLLGDSRAIINIPDDYNDYTDRHRRLIGEFLRRHHPRLAHDLALGLDVTIGLPSLLDNFTSEERDLIGLIARSHGDHLRSSFTYISDRYDLRDYNRTHIVFIMAMLRIADYAQLQASRAPLFKTLIHRIESPISRQEWRVHASIKNITRSHDDPHAVYVDAQPSSTSDYLRLKDWLMGLQSELDICWAVFGEIYGRQVENGLSNLGFFLRRVRSSLFERGESFPFVPEKISFRVAEAEMLSLLLAPLYGSNPGYGVRELIQNAVDAAEEALVSGALREEVPFVRVVVSIDNDEGRLTVEDNGVGMTLAVIRDYFLNAGASFRSSMSWKREFTTETGQVKVLRNGRFGVGALAAFLVGDRLIVSTRARTEPRGYHFEASLHDEPIEVRQKELAFGTKIEIPFLKNAIAPLREFVRLAPHLFKFKSSVKISCAVVEKQTISEVTLNHIANNAIDLKTDNYRLSVYVYSPSDRFAEVHYVNGIAISSIRDPSYSRGLISELRFITPPNLFEGAREGFKVPRFSIHLTDLMGVAPINLSRNEFTQPDAEVTKAIYEQAETDMILGIEHLLDARKRANSKSLGSVSISGFIFFRRGVCPIDTYVLNSSSIRSIYVIPSEAKKDKIIRKFENFALWFSSHIHDDNRTNLLRRLRSINQNSFNIEFAIVSVSTDMLNTFEISKIPQWLLHKIETAETIERNGSRLSLLTWKQPSTSLMKSFVELRDFADTRYLEYFQFSEWSDTPQWGRIDYSQTGFSTTWMEGHPQNDHIHQIV